MNGLIPHTLTVTTRGRATKAYVDRNGNSHEMAVYSHTITLRRK